MASLNADTLEASGNPNEQAKSNSKLVRILLEVAVLILAVVLALLIRFTIFEAAQVTSESMVPTLEKNDRFLVDHRASLHGRWQRGDVVLFESPPSWDDVPDTLVKRVIGLPGETIEINEGKVYIDGKILDEPYINKEADPIGDMGARPIPAGHYFVMGDNRNNSEDSRDKGFLEDKDIRGRGVWVLAPLTRFGQMELPRY